MSHLPVGWTVSNKDGARAGPARRPSLGPDDDSGSEGDGQGLDIAPDSPGWEDVDAEEDEDLNVKCLLCSEAFPQPHPMLEHCTSAHNVNLLNIVRQHSLDFYGTIKLVNYIRTNVMQGQSNVDLSKAEMWSDDKFLQPAMENDALLFSLDELIEDASSEQNGKVADWDDMQAARAAREQKAELDDVPDRQDLPSPRRNYHNGDRTHKRAYSTPHAFEQLQSILNLQHFARGAPGPFAMFDDLTEANLAWHNKHVDAYIYGSPNRIMEFFLAQRKELRDRGLYVTSSLSSEAEAFLRFDHDDQVEKDTSSGIRKQA